MPKEKREFRIIPIATEANDGSAKGGLPVMRSVRARDGGEYLVPMPGILPPGLHLSIHPSGELHLKSRDHGVVARLDLKRLVAGIKLGGLDSVFSELLREPRPGGKSVGTIIAHEFVNLVRQSGPTAELPADRLVESMREVEIDDTRLIPDTLAWLRSEGFLTRGGSVLFRVGDDGRSSFFIDAGGPAAAESLPVDLPPELPFAGTIRAAAQQLRNLGGIMITFPENDELERLADRAGLGDFLRGLRAFADDPSLARFDADVRQNLEDLGLEQMFGDSLKSIVARRPLRPPGSRVEPQKTADDH